MEVEEQQEEDEEKEEKTINNANGNIVSWCFKPCQSQTDYIRAEGDFHKEMYG